MTKHFTNFPKELEQYNPEELKIGNFEKLRTIDKNGFWHSFNDQPALILQLEPKKSATQNFLWYSHGELSREGNFPPAINISADGTIYETLNERGQRHSYHDLPAYLNNREYSDEIWIRWYSKGYLHREQDLPAIIVVRSGKVTEEIFYKNGKPHRGNGLPAQIEATFTAWSVEGGVHNIKAAAIKEYDQKRACIRDQWGLYGVIIPEGTFNLIIGYQKRTRAPLWVAFLHIMEIVTEKEVKSFITPAGDWDSSVPTEWLLRCWGVTDEKFDTKVKKALGSFDEFNDLNEIISHEDYSLKLFMKIVKSDEAYANSVET
jgi:hypothetical protein